MKKTISILAFFLISSAVLVPVVTTSCDDNEKKYLIMNYGHDPFGMGTSNSAAYAAYYNGTRYLGADLEFTYTPQFEFISSAHTSFIYELWLNDYPTASVTLTVTAYFAGGKASDMITYHI